MGYVPFLTYAILFNIQANFDFLLAAVFFFKIPFAAAWSIFFVTKEKDFAASSLLPSATQASNFLMYVLRADLIIWFLRVFV